MRETYQNLYNSSIAQLVEYSPTNQKDVGSNLAIGNIFLSFLGFFFTKFCFELGQNTFSRHIFSNQLKLNVLQGSIFFNSFNMLVFVRGNFFIQISRFCDFYDVQSAAVVPASLHCVV